jgi:hypothetical protein
MSATPPDRIELVQELRRAIGLFDGAMPITPKEAWEEAIAEVVRLHTIAVSGWCYQCEQKARMSSRADGGGA